MKHKRNRYKISCEVLWSSKICQCWHTTKNAFGNVNSGNITAFINDI